VRRVGARQTPFALPVALRVNEPVASAEIARFGHALGASDPADRCEELACLTGYGRLRDLGIPEDGLRQVADVSARLGALANPRPASPQQIFELFHSIW